MKFQNKMIVYQLSKKEINSKDKVIAISDNRSAYINYSNYSDATSFNNAMCGQYLYYELETPITMTIDGNEAVTQIKNDLGGLSFSVSGTTLSITDGTNTWTLPN